MERRFQALLQGEFKGWVHTEDDVWVFTISKDGEDWVVDFEEMG